MAFDQYMRRVWLGVGVLLLMNALRLAFVAFLSNDMLFYTGLSVGVLLYGFFYKRLQKIRWLTVLRRAATVCMAGLIFFLILFGLRQTTSGQEKVVLVLGAGIKGERVTAVLQARLDKALAFFADNPDAVILVSGGQGPEEQITEALAMARYLIDHGVPAAQIIKEEQSSSTYENMQYAKMLLEPYLAEGHSVVLITNAFHMYRATCLAEAAEIPVVRYPAKTPLFSLPHNYLRECAAVIKYRLLRY